MFGWGAILLGMLREGIAEGSNTFGIRKMRIGRITSYYKVPSVKFESEAADGKFSVAVIIGCAGFSFCIPE